MGTRLHTSAQELASIACLGVGLFLVGHHLANVALMIHIWTDPSADTAERAGWGLEAAAVLLPTAFGVALIFARGAVARWAFPEPAETQVAIPIAITERLIVLAAGLFILTDALPLLAFDVYVNLAEDLDFTVQFALSVFRCLFGAALVVSASSLGHWIAQLRTAKPNLE